MPKRYRPARAPRPGRGKHAAPPPPERERGRVEGDGPYGFVGSSIGGFGTGIGSAAR